MATMLRYVATGQIIEFSKRRTFHHFGDWISAFKDLLHAVANSSDASVTQEQVHGSGNRKKEIESGKRHTYVRRRTCTYTSRSIRLPSK